ncbi:MAG: hypothetical protein R3B96_04750 [Pirellulaceae bacterium]|nr:hypothetical protein [Planctomycetales bacterium]
MHTLDLMDQAFEAARAMGYEVRREWLGGASGGRCEFGGRRFIFLDASLNQLEQLDQLREALATAPEAQLIPLGPTMRRFLSFEPARRAA